MNGRGAPGAGGGDPRDNADRVHRLETPLKPFRPFYASQLEGYTPKPRQWLVDGVLMRRTVTLFVGPPKIGKSLLLQQLLTSVATGLPWLGHACERGRAFGMFTEDPAEEINRRQLDINAAYDRAAADYELDLSWQTLEGEDALLVEFDRYGDQPKFTPLWHQLWQFVEDEGIEIVGLDTAAVIFGGNENFRGQVTNFMRGLVAQAVAKNCGIVLTAHPSKISANSYSGSTAWLGSARSAMSLGRPADYDPENGPHNERVLRGLGSNYAAGLIADKLEYHRGVMVPADPELQTHKAKRGPLNHTERMDLEYRLLAGLKNVMKNGGLVLADEGAAMGLVNRARRSPNPMLNGVSLNDLAAAQDALLASGRVVRVSVGSKCLLRPADGPYYAKEQPWLDLMTPPAKEP